MLSSMTPPVRLLLVDDNHDSLVSAAASLRTRRLGEVRVSTFREDQIVRNELLLTRIDRRRIDMMTAEVRPFVKASHLEMLDSWETSIQRRLASAWVLPQTQ